MINGSALAARLVDELIVIISPDVDGRSDSHGIVEADEAGLRGRLKLSLRNCETLEHGAARLIYTVTPDSD